MRLARCDEIGLSRCARCCDALIVDRLSLNSNLTHAEGFETRADLDPVLDEDVLLRSRRLHNR